jgi:hypothetical protein
MHAVEKLEDALPHPRAFVPRKRLVCNPSRNNSNHVSVKTPTMSARRTIAEHKDIGFMAVGCAVLGTFFGRKAFPKEVLPLAFALGTAVSGGIIFAGHKLGEAAGDRYIAKEAQGILRIPEADP